MEEIFYLWHHDFGNGDAYALFKLRDNADKYVEANPGSEVISLLVIDHDG